MPTYEYQCQTCGKVFEHFQSMTEDALKTCPFDGCQGKVKRLVSGGTGLIFKGSGFYETDYKRKSAGGGAKTTRCPASQNNSCPNSEACKAAS